MRVWLSLSLLALTSGAELSILDFGAIASTKTTAAASANAAALNAALANATNGDTVVVPSNSNFYCNGGVVVSNAHGIGLRVDGTLTAVSNFTAWPVGAASFDHSSPLTAEEQLRAGKSEYAAFIEVIASSHFTLSGEGLIDGGGKPWWNQYVLKPLASKRPKLVHFINVTDIVIAGTDVDRKLRLLNSPSFHVLLSDVARVEIRFLDITVDRSKLKALKAVLRARRTLRAGASGFPLQPEDLNTDGIDPAGRDVWIHDCSIVNDDDSIAVKPLQQLNPGNVNANCSENMMIERMNITGMGLSIGSVPPHAGRNCVRNITFRNILMPGTGKGVYIKSDPSCIADGSKTAIITDILYENITINKPDWWAIWIGPQQQHEPGQALGQKCALDYPVSKSCPTQGCVDFRNITLRQIKIVHPLLSPGVLLGNKSNPMQVTFDRVIVDKPALFPFDKTYKCESVQGTATDSTPKPPCMT